MNRVEELGWISVVSQTQSVSTQGHFLTSKLSTAAAAYPWESRWLTHWCLHPLISVMPCPVRVKEAAMQLLSHHFCCFHALGCQAVCCDFHCRGSVLSLWSIDSVLHTRIRAPNSHSSSKSSFMLPFFQKLHSASVQCELGIDQGIFLLYYPFLCMTFFLALHLCSHTLCESICLWYLVFVR